MSSARQQWNKLIIINKSSLSQVINLSEFTKDKVKKLVETNSSISGETHIKFKYKRLIQIGKVVEVKF